MTSRAHIPVEDSDALERMAWRSGASIERSSDLERVYLTMPNGVTYWAPSPNEVTC
ncbi:hypothetical protein NOK12_16980 [Nocardioides sp. OK12]|uniref:hypothetical protein n=1 Tax=Nocardioides sp. OK12 TaxID=2758661 RepID=UPI0021C2CB96|nr:hypothetical protein [Nocardioides sp. OK12]GHJ59180.1 hypothetical protein NOK12_16980 [Nocardioides sp. OK12]